MAGASRSRARSVSAPPSGSAFRCSELASALVVELVAELVLCDQALAGHHAHQRPELSLELFDLLFVFAGGRTEEVVEVLRDLGGLAAPALLLLDLAALHEVGQRGACGD